MNDTQLLLDRPLEKAISSNSIACLKPCPYDFVSVKDVCPGGKMVARGLYDEEHKGTKITLDIVYDTSNLPDDFPVIKLA